MGRDLIGGNSSVGTYRRAFESVPSPQRTCPVMAQARSHILRVERCLEFYPTVPAMPPLTPTMLSLTHMCSHLVGGQVSGEIWAHGEFLRFTTMTPGSITTWQVGFASAHSPTEVGTMSNPDGCSIPGVFLAHPILPRLALVREGRVRIWDTQDSKFLLESGQVGCDWRMSFSPDGRFFACNSMTPEGKSTGIYLWKESHTGYVLHQKLTSDFGAIRPLISPNGGSVIAFGDLVIQLWHTMDPATSLSTVSAQTSQSSGKDFVLRFSPDETLAAVMRKKDKTITVPSGPQVSHPTTDHRHGYGGLLFRGYWEQRRRRR